MGKFWTTAHWKVEEFRRGRTRQANDAFVEELGMGDGAYVRDVALAVRRAVASVGLVDPLYIRLSDRAEAELAVLPLWHSMEWVALIMELENELGMELPDRAFGKVVHRRMSVRSCIADTVEVVRKLRAETTA